MKLLTLPLFAFLLCAQIAIAQTQFYVKPTGNNASNGTSIATAWKTINHAMQHATPGSTVHILAGTYTEKTSVGVNGTANQRITFRNYNNDVVKLNGGATAGQTMIEILNKNYITIQGIWVTNNQKNYAEGIRIEGDCAGIQIVGCKISSINFSTDPNLAANPNRNSNPLLAVGSSPNAGITNLLVSGCTVYSNRTGYSENISLVGNVNGFEISNNTVRDNKNIGIDMIGGYNECPDPAKDFARNGLVKGNTCYNNKSPYATAAGIYVDGARDIVIENNKCYNGQWGIEVGAEENGAIAQNITVRNNVIYNNDESGIACGGYNFPTTGKVVNCKFTGNTLLLNDRLTAGEGEIFTSYSENCVFKNNLVYARRAYFISHDGLASPAPPTLNYNCWWRTIGSPNTAEFNLNGTYYTGYAAYKTGTGQDANSIFADPLLTSTSVTAPNMHLLAGSPCINAGDPVYTAAPTEKDLDLAARIFGARIDIGVDESGSMMTLATEERLETEEATAWCKVFPNPSSGAFTAQFSQNTFENAVSIQVFDLMGRVVLSRNNCSEQEMIDLGKAEAGVYFLEIKDGQQVAARQRLLVVK